MIVMFLLFLALAVLFGMESRRFYAENIRGLLWQACGILATAFAVAAVLFLWSALDALA